MLFALYICSNLLLSSKTTVSNTLACRFFFCYLEKSRRLNHWRIRNNVQVNGQRRGRGMSIELDFSMDLLLFRWYLVSISDLSYWLFSQSNFFNYENGFWCLALEKRRRAQFKSWLWYKVFRTVSTHEKSGSHKVRWGLTLAWKIDW